LRNFIQKCILYPRHPVSLLSSSSTNPSLEPLLQKDTELISPINDTSSKIDDEERKDEGRQLFDEKVLFKLFLMLIYIETFRKAQEEMGFVSPKAHRAS